MVAFHSKQRTKPVGVSGFGEREEGRERERESEKPGTTSSSLCLWSADEKKPCSLARPNLAQEHTHSREYGHRKTPISEISGSGVAN